MEVEGTRSKWIRVGAVVIGIALLGGLGWHYWHSLQALRLPQLNRAAFIQTFRGDGIAATIPLALLLMAVSLIPGAPNAVIAVLNGVCLGAPLGFVVNVVGLSCGNALGAILVDHLAIKRQSQKHSRLLDDLLKAQHPRIGVALGYSVPFIPNTLVHVAAAELKLPRRVLNGLIALGSLPTAFFYAFGGDAALRWRPGRLTVALILLVASAGVILVIRRDRRKGDVAK